MIMGKLAKNIILYRYNGSPFAHKIESVLAMRGIPHYEVDVPMVLPRPEVMELLGIGYRRIPLLAIGNDVYCDTSLIVPQLEKRVPHSHEYPTLFPSRKDGGKVDSGIIKAFAASYGDRTLFPLGGSIIPYAKFDKTFVEDRAKWQGVPSIPVEKLAKMRPEVDSKLSSHMEILEEQFRDGRQYLFDTEGPGFGDLSIHFFWEWMTKFRGMKEVLSPSKFPNAMAWVARMSKYLAERRAATASTTTKINGDEAAKLIFGDGPLRDKLPFDSDEATRLGLKLGDTVSIVPEDNARNYPTIGKLIGLNREEFVLEIVGKSGKTLRCHFPRLNFKVRKADAKL